MRKPPAIRTTSKPRLLLPARLGQLVAQRVDLLHRQLEQLGQQAGGHRLDGHDQHGLDGPGLGGQGHAHPSYSSYGAGADRHQVRVVRHPGHLEVAEGVALVEGDPALLAQLEQGQEAHDDLDAGGQVAGQGPEGGPAAQGRQPDASSDTASATVTVSTVTW